MGGGEYKKNSFWEGGWKLIFCGVTKEFFQGGLQKDFFKGGYKRIFQEGGLQKDFSGRGVTKNFSAKFNGFDIFIHIAKVAAKYYFMRTAYI